MKKIYLLSSLLIILTTSQAQNFTKPKLTLNAEHCFISQISIDIRSQMMALQNLAFTTETKYTVKSTNNDSTVIQYDIVKNHADSDMAHLAMNGDYRNMQAFQGIPVLLSANADGSLKRVLNLSELRSVMKATMENKPIPTSSRMISNNLIGSTINDNIIMMALGITPLFQFYGRNLTNGFIEDAVFNNIKIRRIYTIDADRRQIEVKMTANMTSDEVKKMFISSVKASGIGNVKQIVQQWPIMVKMGMDKLDFNGYERYLYDTDGWIFSYTQDITTKIMGVDTHSLKILKKK